MSDTRIRTFCIDGDSLDVEFKFDKESQKFIGLYPDFEFTPRFTESGFTWVNATQDGCENALSRYSPEKVCMDCGSCKHYITEKDFDLIGVCGYVQLESQC